MCEIIFTYAIDIYKIIHIHIYIMSVESKIVDLIDKKKITKKSVYEAIGMTQKGFLDMIKNETLTVKKLILICDFIHIHPGVLFENKEEDFEEFVKSDIWEEYKFQKEQIRALTEIINNLTKKE